ncbi:MAG TPA: putative metal-binding motif-containing protein [Kofleriaceae bacterium]|nr:putative metal-binding motif-containing protein [Kofleriaceae bacterium]
MRKTVAMIFGSCAWLAAACGGEGASPFEIKPECKGDAVVAYQGMQPQVISKLSIGSREDGFDFNGDGEPDNKLAAAASIAQGAIDDALGNYEIVIPLEFFDLTAAAADSCVKFAVYLGDYVKDGDGDGSDPLVKNGDCNDKDPAIKRGAAEIGSNRKDDDCDGLADEDAQDNPSNNPADMDGDGQSLADGDCDDTNAAVKKGVPEVCGDGLDNDCDGTADRTGGAVATACSPFDPASLQDIPLDPLSFVDGQPVVVFHDGTIEKRDGVMLLHAGPSLFSVSVPVIDDVSLDLRISGATIEAEVTEEAGAIVLKHARLGGVIDAVTADTIRGLDVDVIGLTPENSLLDATFANLLGQILSLPKAGGKVDAKYPGCRTPDIDVDRDGLEAFCDSNPGDTNKSVDVCIDGDGTELTDVLDADGKVVMSCTEAMVGGSRRFVDGISVALTFDTSPIKAITPPR